MFLPYAPKLPIYSFFTSEIVCCLPDGRTENYKIEQEKTVTIPASYPYYYELFGGNEPSVSLTYYEHIITTVSGSCRPDK